MQTLDATGGIVYTAEELFAKEIRKLRNLRPFYSAVYEVIEKIENSSEETVGVTEDQMIYNKQFIESLTFEEFTFIMLHEIGHIALMHIPRRKNRDPKLWNIVCDYYINKVLYDEFSLYRIENQRLHGVSLPEGLLLDDSVDINIDYPEEMYAKLAEQAGKNGYFKDSLTNNGNNGKSYEFSLDTHDSSPGSGKKFWVDKGYKGDMRESGNTQELKEQLGRKVSATASVKMDMQPSIGSEKGLLERLAGQLLKSKVNWKRLLKKYLVASRQTDSSFASPDKRMYYQSAIYPGQSLDANSKVRGVKVCIDTSGSISDEDLQHFFGQVYELTSKYKVDAELIYWDAAVQSCGKFKDYKEFERVKCFGGGGTNPAVLFDYFSSKKCAVKPIVTLIFTDGYFGDSYGTPINKKKYKDTIWIMTKDHSESFKPVFGIKALAKFGE